jgi:hypothetical protein
VSDHSAATNFGVLQGSFGGRIVRERSRTIPLSMS